MRGIYLLLAMPLLAFAQLDDNTLTVTASRIVNPQPDQVVIAVEAFTGPDGTLDDAVKLVGRAGITADEFVGVTSFGFWRFQLTIPITKMQATLRSLAALQSGRVQTPVTYSVLYSRVSPDLQKSLCVYPALMSDAQALAQKMATAAGVKVGAVASISDQAPASRQGDFTQAVFVIDALVPVLGGVFAPSQAVLSQLYTPAAPTTCSMTVQFQLVQ